MRRYRADLETRLERPRERPRHPMAGVADVLEVPAEERPPIGASILGPGDRPASMLRPEDDLPF